MNRALESSPGCWDEDAGCAAGGVVLAVLISALFWSATFWAAAFWVRWFGVALAG